MAWTYSGDPSTNDKDAIRFQIGDTDASDPLMLDEEIAFAIAQESSLKLAIARCCEVLARKFARLADTRLGPAAISFRNQSQAFWDMAKQLRANATLGMYVGGVNPEEERKDMNLNQPAFKRDFMSNVKERY